MSRTTTKIIIARQDGSVLGQYVLGAGEHVIGRELDAAIYIDDPGVSRAHARLIISEDLIELEDLQSTSGTYVDGVAVRGRIPLEPSQKVHISDLYIDIVREGFRELVAGARLTEGRFTLIRLLGQGGMGAVWLARDEAQSRQVALKLLPLEMAHDASSLEALQREVAKTARFNHANILKIEGLIITEGEPPFILMEYVEGTDLDEVRRKNPDKLMVWSGVRHYMLQLCEALEYAHDQRIAHRDLKPSNLLINPQAELKLADFGIASSIAGTVSTLTTSVLSAGTPSYMSPQQVEGRRPQAADDIYSLGATFYDLLVGKPPFYQGDIVHQVLNVPATPIKERLMELNLQNDVPDYVSAMVMACLQKDPVQRPPSANSVRKWIETEGKADFVAGEQVAWDKTPSPTRHIPEPVPSAVKEEGLPVAKRRKILAYGIAAAVMAILIGTATWWTGRPKEINGVSVALQAQTNKMDELQSSNITPKNPMPRVIEAEIRKRINKPAGPLTKVDLERVTKLELNDKAINDLVSLEGLVNLDILLLRNNQITDLTPIASLQKLTQLDVDGNQISDLSPLLNLTGLKSLRLRDNPQLTRVQVLKLNHAIEQKQKDMGYLNTVIVYANAK